MRVSTQAAAVLTAVKHVDEHAVVLLDLPAHQVHIAPAAASATQLSDAIIHAGFDPVLRGSSGGMAQGRRQAPPRIPFDGADHDFSAAPGEASTPADEETAPAEGPADPLREGDPVPPSRPIASTPDGVRPAEVPAPPGRAAPR
jgi:hypothetical protein